MISGYLITGIIARELNAGNFSIFRFYETRIRRIFPVLLTVLLFVLLCSCFLLLPSEFRVLGIEAFGSLLFLANIVLWRESGYFAADAEAKPLLHMWSLGVEEQFYIFMPLALWLIYRYGPRYKIAAVSLGWFMSLAACVLLTPSFQNASFYLLPTRAWELLTGSLLALWTARCPLAAGRWPLAAGRCNVIVQAGALSGAVMLFFLRYLL